MTDEPLLYTTRDDGVAVVSIHDDPLNRMSLAFIDELQDVVADIDADDSIRSFVITAHREGVPAMVDWIDSRS